MDLTIPFALWTFFWAYLALVTQSWTWLLVGLAPWGMFLALIVLLLTVMYLRYRQGEQVTITTSKTRRYIQRGRSTIIERIEN